MRYSIAVFFTQIRPVGVDDLGTGEKNDISLVGVFIRRFCYEYLIKRMLGMRLITQKILR
jgi:hypothetical protein